VKGSAAVSRVKVWEDGQGVVPYAGVCMLREVADLTGLSSQVTAAGQSKLQFQQIPSTNGQTANRLPKWI
jgi:hypothetical protein